MPELPEVESLRRKLVPRLVGRRLGAVDVHETRLRYPLEAERFAAGLAGRRITGLARRSKYLLVELSGARLLLVHLGMSGRLLLCPRAEPLEDHVHVRIALSGGRGEGREELRYRDPRRFGFLECLSVAAWRDDPRHLRLGPEPLEEACDAAHLQRAAGRSRRPVKTFLMDAGVIVGVGNIYASEALHRAGIHPARAAGRIATVRWERLIVGLRDILGRAIEAGGSSIRDWQDSSGTVGGFQAVHAVYGRAGEPCPRCQRRVRRLVQCGRSTFYCPGCQR